MEFTIVDAAVAVVVLISGALAYARGFTRELFAIGGWIIAFVIAYYLAPALEPLIREVPVVGETLANSCLIAISAAFFLIVAISLVVLSIFTPLIANLVLDSVLAPLDRLLGFIFGIARGALLVAIVFVIYSNFSGANAWPPLDNAASKQAFEKAAGQLEAMLPESIPEWFQARADALMVNCEATPQPQLENGQVPQTGTTDTGTTDTGTAGTGTTDTGTTDTGTTGTGTATGN